MLTSFFNKSKPINFLLVGLLVSFFYILFNFTGENQSWNWLEFLKDISALFVFLLLLLFANYSMVKIKPENRHTFVLIIFSAFCISIPTILTTHSIIVAGLFTVMGVRRTLALQSGKNTKKKIFDSFFWFGLASLVFPPSLFFMGLAIIGMFYFVPYEYKNWLIPFFSILAVFILATFVSHLFTGSFFNYFSIFSFQITPPQTYLHSPLIWPASWLFLHAAWMFISVLTKPDKVTQKEKKSKHLILSSLFIAIIVIAFSQPTSSEKGSELLFLIIPVSLIGGKYFENHQRRKFKNILLIIMLIGCIGNALLYNSTIS